MQRPITKEEKEEENNKKTAPVLKTYKPRVPGQAYFLENLTKEELNALPARFSHIRHHLERTTGPGFVPKQIFPLEDCLKLRSFFCCLVLVFQMLKKAPCCPHPHVKS